MTDSSIVLCATESEITEKRNRLKKWAKEQGIFSRVVGNSVQFTTGLAVTFVLAEQQEFDEEPLPREAFE